LIGQHTFSQLIQATHLLSIIQQNIKANNCISRSRLYLFAVSNELNGSSIVRDSILFLKKVNSQTLSVIFDAIANTIHHFSAIDISSFQQRLAELASSPSEILQSQHDIRSSSARTSLTAQEIELSRPKSSLSKDDTAYYDLLEEFCKNVQNYLEDALVDLHNIPFHEIFVYDTKPNQTDPFVPRPRYALERALSSPADYLGCECCRSVENNDTEVLQAIRRSENMTDAYLGQYICSACNSNCIPVISRIRASN
jgi:origin recognition complex subunit 3